MDAKSTVAKDVIMEALLDAGRKQEEAELIFNRALLDESREDILGFDTFKTVETCMGTGKNEEVPSFVIVSEDGGDTVKYKCKNCGEESNTRFEHHQHYDKEHIYIGFGWKTETDSPKLMKPLFDNCECVLCQKFTHTHTEILQEK